MGRQATRPLRILFLANFSGAWNNPDLLADVLGQLGHTVTRRHEFAIPRAVSES